MPDITYLGSTKSQDPAGEFLKAYIAARQLEQEDKNLNQRERQISESERANKASEGFRQSMDEASLAETSRHNQAMENIQYKQVELDKEQIANLPIQRKIEAVKLLNDSLAHIPEANRIEVLADPNVIELFNSAGVPMPRFESEANAEPKDWSEVGILSRAMAALTPSATKEEKRLGGLYPNEMLNPPTFPSGVTEEDIQYTMKKHGLSRGEVLRRLKK